MIRKAFPKGSITTFYEDASMHEARSGLTVATMVATVIDGTSITIESQTYSAANKELSFQLNFARAGAINLEVATTFSGSSEKVITPYRFTSTTSREEPIADYL